MEHLKPRERIQSTNAQRLPAGVDVRLVHLSSVAADPMTGKLQKYEAETGWVDDGDDVNIYIHPQSALDQYKVGKCWVVKIGTRWYALNVGNVPLEICSGS